MENPRLKPARPFRLPRHVTPYVFALYMSTFMAFFMCMVITYAAIGFGEHYLARVMDAYRVAMPSAFVCVLVVRPLVARMVAWTVHPH
jgi:hypothetical protein